jgi:hypothetical protein
MSGVPFEQRVANSLWFIQMMDSLKDGGHWVGDHGSGQKRGNKLHVDAKTYKYLRRILVSIQVLQRVVCDAPTTKKATK